MTIMEVHWCSNQDSENAKHLYCPVFTSRGYKKDMAHENPDFIGVFFVSCIRFREPKMVFDKRKRLPMLLCAGSRSWIFRYLS